MIFEVYAKTPEGVPAAGVYIEFGDQVTGQNWTRYTDGGGYANVNAPGAAPGRPFTIEAGNGWQLAETQRYFIAGSDPKQTVTLQVTPSFNGPARWTIPQLCAVRGSLWTARLNIDYGPRPGQPSNINALDYAELYPPAERQRMYRAVRAQGYSHCPDGPMWDAGYHGQYPTVDFRGNPDAYFAVLAEKWRAGLCPVHFAYSDLYGFGPDAFDTFVREMEPIYRSPAAQQLIRVWVPYGWERGYEVTSEMWVRMLQWARGVLPKALVGIHLVSDQDAPTGGNDDKIPGWTNAAAWHAVAPYTHLWFVQNAGYINEGNPVPSSTFLANFTNQFRPDVTGSLANRFVHGYAGWPTFSAFGSDVPIQLIAGEYASFADYWQNWPEIEAQKLGDAAIAAGAAGAFDGCLAAR